MAGLQRSQVSFRRQGSSGLVWDDKLLTAQLNKSRKEHQKMDMDAADDYKPPINIAPINTLDKSRSTGGGRGYRTVRVSPAIEPPSPRLTICGCCGAFGSHRNKPPKATTRRARTGKPRSR